MINVITTKDMGKLPTAQRLLVGKLMDVSDLEAKVEEYMGIKVNDQKLFFAGAPLDQKDTKLGDLDMFDGDTVIDEPPVAEIVEGKKHPIVSKNPPLPDEIWIKGVPEKQNHRRGRRYN